MPHSKILFFTCLGFIAGVGIASFVEFPKLVVWEFFILGLIYFGFFLAMYLQKANPSRFLKGIALGLFLMAFSLGIFRGINLAEFKSSTPNTSANLSMCGTLCSVKEKFRDIINSNLPNPQSAILAGILLGDKASFSKEWKQKLSNTGTSHIVAVSGMNIVMLSSILVALGVILGFYRGQALWFSLILIWLFIALIGFQASAVRAGIMGSILIVCQILGRRGANFRALCLAITVMLLIQPELLRYSLSFGLSVLATLGLIELSPLIKRKVHSEIVSVTLSAQVFTMPLLIYSFSSISLIGLPVNLLIVPLLPIVMVLGIIFLFSALLNSFLAVMFAIPVGLLLSFIVWVIDIFSKVPFSVLRV